VIDFRYHLVSIVAVFLALAIGIVLGSTELQGPAYNFLDKTTAKLQTELGQVSSQRDTAQAQASAGNAFAATVQPAVLKNLLPGQRVLIVTEPGAQASVISGITTAATDAGASVTGQINLQPKFFDTTDTTQDTLNQTTLDIAQHSAIVLDSTATYQQQAAQVIASEILVKSESSATGSSATGSSATGSSATGSASSAGLPSAGADQGTGASTMLTAYAASQFLSTSGRPGTPATLTVVVTPQNAPADGSSDPLDQVLVPVVQELAAKSSATVVVGSSGGSAAGSPIAVLRQNNVASHVSTVDNADLTIGQTAAIQALAVLLGGGKSGSYGFTANGASAVAPSPVPTPSASPSTTVSPAATKKAKK
jgi:hypothetical protein